MLPRVPLTHHRYKYFAFHKCYILVWRDLGSIRKNNSTVGVVSLVAKARRLRRKARARDKGRIRLRARARLLWSRFSVSIRDLLCVFIGARA